MQSPQKQKNSIGECSEDLQKPLKSEDSHSRYIEPDKQIRRNDTLGMMEIILRSHTHIRTLAAIFTAVNFHTQAHNVKS